ncbi:MAG: outer spore coat copper-dependent laccase CotA [Ktedonobacteraceae bacterium]
MAEELQPPPRPYAHQKWAEFPPQRFYTLQEEEFQWQFHSDYGKKTWTWGYSAPEAEADWQGTHITPGPTFHARYGEPILVRRINNLPLVGYHKVGFALPSTTMHRHNGHQASESDGDPNDWIDTGDFWDHHYPNAPATLKNPASGLPEPDDREKLTTLWYHDHRMDSTAANVYAGLVGFFLMFDEQDSGNENDPSENAWRLPSGEFDVPLILHDLLFDKDHQLVFDGFATDGVIGDRFTVNRIIQPHFQVKRRKYRFRILNGGPSRFYQLFLHVGENQQNSQDPANDPDNKYFIIISGDGNLQPEPVESKSIVLGVAQRVDVIIDFSQYKEGDTIYLENRLDQHHGHGPSQRLITETEEIKKHRLMRFDVVVGDVEDPSHIPDFFRSFPPVDLDSVKRKRVWVFDYDGGLWTINGREMDPDRIDAGIERDSAEIWTFRNNGNNWWHPIHNHLSEWLVLEVNGIPVSHDSVQIRANTRGGQDFQRVFTKNQRKGDYNPHGPEKSRNILKGPWCGGFRRDIALLGPRTEITMFNRWPDFLGKYVMHCHNVVHEDHTMMIRWDVVPPGEGFEGPRMASEVYGTNPIPPHMEARPAQATVQPGPQTLDPLMKK